MEKIKTSTLIFFLLMLWVVPQAWSAGLSVPITYSQLEKEKSFYDDPRPFYNALDWKKYIPKEEVEKVLIDVEASKARWVEVIGYKAPDLVGKIAPEIKPGIYTYKDKEKYPGLKELMIPNQYEHFAPGAPPHAGNVSQMEIIPTRQYYEPLAFGDLTAKNLGKTKQDDKGYLVWNTFDGGIPWPKPSGPHKAMQILYDQIFAPQICDGGYILGRGFGFTKELKQDYESKQTGGQLMTHGRILSPQGWYDDRAKENGEIRTRGVVFLAPRDSFGLVFTDTQYIDPLKPTTQLMYLPGFRRVRKLSSTDTQDVYPGSDTIVDDNMGFTQKMNPNIFPYEYKVIAEREFLVQAYSLDGSETISSPEKGVERVNTKWERRPLWVVELTQLDKSYTYSKRILYVDRETFQFCATEAYDQKGKLYRSFDMMCGFIPEAGIVNLGVTMVQRDHIDPHTTVLQTFCIPDPRCGREVGSVNDMMGIK